MWIDHGMRQKKKNRRCSIVGDIVTKKIQELELLVEILEIGKRGSSIFGRIGSKGDIG